MVIEIFPTEILLNNLKCKNVIFFLKIVISVIPLGIKI